MSPSDRVRRGSQFDGPSQDGRIVVHKVRGQFRLVPAIRSRQRRLLAGERPSHLPAAAVKLFNAFGQIWMAG